MLTAADAAWLSYTITITSSADLPSQSTMRALHAFGRARCAALWTLRYLLAETTRVLPALFADACHPDVTPERIAQLIATAHAEYVRALTRLTHVSTSFSHPSTAPPSTTTSSPTTVCQRFTNRLRAHLQAKCVTPHLALALYRMFKARVAEGRPRQIEAYLVDLGFARVADDALSWAVFERLDALVASHVSSPTVRAVPDLLQWVRQFTASSSSSSSSSSTPSSPSLSSSLSSESAASLWTKRLEFHLHESVCDSRTEQLLSLIEQFPRSMPALHDLRDCFRCTDRKPFVAQSLRRQFENALLNAGTQTADILQRYVSTIRTLRFLDPSGVVLDCVSAPIRAYLRRRPDTVRCIVSGMTGDGDLYEELQRGRDSSRLANSHSISNTDGVHPTSATRDACEDNLTITTATSTGTATTTATTTTTAANGGGNGGGGASYDDAAQQQQQQLDLGGNEDDEDHDCQSIDGDVDVKGRVNVAEYDAWEPEPIDAPVPDDGHWRRRGGDAIATLVNIYGSSEQIVAEYRSLLADKLVSQFDVDIAREERILSLLTERFGKTTMHDCVIMLKDVRDSRAVLQQQNGDDDENRERSNVNGNGKENEHEIDNAKKKQKRIESKHERDNDENDDDDDDDDAGGGVQKHAGVRAGTGGGVGSAGTSANAKHGWFDATVISREFWPRLGDEGAFHAPPEIQTQMRAFATAFGRAKKARKLKWLHGLGACRVRLEFDDGRVVNAAVSPMQAAALDVFARVGRVALPDLAKHLGIKDEDQAVLRRKVVALANRGILRLVSPGVYEPVEDGVDMSMGGRGSVASSNRLKNHQSGGSSSTNAAGSAAAALQRQKQQQQQHVNGGVVKDNGVDIDVDEIVDVDDDDDDDDVFGNGNGADADDADDEGQQEMAVYETYIIAMLTNLKQLSLEQIHTMLKRFVQTPAYDKTQTQLANFLVTLVDKGKVEVAAGIYKVKKKS